MYNEANNRSEHMKEFANKVAEKLGVPTEKVAEAMRSVRKEWMDQMITERSKRQFRRALLHKQRLDKSVSG